MIPLELIDTADLPDGGQLRLMRRGQDYSILFGRNELMSSRLRGSEEALATLAWEPIANRSKPKFLIGGLGMGFTMRAAIKILPPGAKIVVSELVPKVLEWAKGPLSHLFGDSLSDPRVDVQIEDVRAMIAETNGTYDAILLDVDNGPDGLIHAENDRLYSKYGLRSAYAALRAGGVLAVWSAYPDHAFAQRLRGAGFEVNEVKVRATGGKKGAHHIVWVAIKPGNK